MRKSLFHFAFGLCFFFLFAACSERARIYFSSQQTPLSEVSGLDEINAPPDAWYFDKGKDPKVALLFIAGSGCVSVQSFLPGYLRDLDGDYRVFAVEKPGVSKGDLGLKCRAEYWEANDFETRLTQNARLLEWLISTGNPYDNILLMGVSEGGPIAAKLVQEYDGAIDAGLVIGSGGLPQRQALLTLNEKHGQVYDLDAIDAAIRYAPDSLDLIYGQTPRYWRSYLDVSTIDLLENTTTPMLFVMGEADQSEPIESLYALEAQNYPNVETMMVPDANHVLAVDGVDQKPAVFDAFLSCLAALGVEV